MIVAAAVLTSGFTVVESFTSRGVCIVRENYILRCDERHMLPRDPAVVACENVHVGVVEAIFDYVQGLRWIPKADEFIKDRL